MGVQEEAEIAKLKKINSWYEKNYGPYIERRGLSNWKNFFRKPTLLEWTIFFMILMTLFMGWAYKHDIEACQQALVEFTNQSWNNENIESDSMPILVSIRGDEGDVG